LSVESTLDCLRGAELIFVSDVHMVEAHDERGELFRNLVKEIGYLQVSKLVLGGDIFEFCFGKTQYFRNKFGPLAQSLAETREQGCEIFLLQGNHEAFLDTLEWHFIEIVKEKDLLLHLGEQNLRVVISHGDLINPPPNYLAYTKVVRSEWFGLGLRLIPSKLLDHLALNLAKKSRSQDQYRTLDHQKLLRDGFRWAKECKAEVGIFGHFHYPYEAEIEGVKILCDWSWAHPNFIAYSSGRWLRAIWKDKSWSVIPIEFVSDLGPGSDGSHMSKFIPGG